MAAAGCIFFLLAGLAFVPLLGVQNDEALFAAAIYPPQGAIYSKPAFGRQVPLMLMSYLGTLKPFIYTPVFRIWTPDVLSIRLPMLLVATLTIWLFYLFLRGVGGRRAAVVGCLLLSTDAAFLLTACFDWGPVVLQHLLLIGGALLIHRAGSRIWPLAGGFFLLGLGLWDKALFAWMLIGLAGATAICYPRPLARRVTPGHVAAAVVALALGASPLLSFNLKTGFSTFRSNARSSAVTELSGKFQMLRSTLETGGLFTWLVREDAEAPRPHAVPALPSRLSTLTGRPRGNLMPWAFLAALLLLPVARGARRVAAFTLLFLTLAWLQMALTANAGGSVHHAVLLWPFPQMFIALVFAAASRRARAGRTVLAAILLLLVLTNALVINEYYVLGARNGGSVNWSDAVFPLVRDLESRRPAMLFALDWGILDTLRLLGEGRMPLAEGSELIMKDALSDDERRELQRRVSNPAHLFLDHTSGNEFFPGRSARLEALASPLGYRREVVAHIPDAHGRPIFEISRFRPAP